MKKIAISAESTVDLTKELIKKYNIHTLPFGIHINDQFFLDGEIDNVKLFELVSETGKLPKTQAVNEFQFIEHFDKLTKEYDAVIHFSLSSEISSAYANGVLAAKNYKNVYVIDSRSLSTGIALLVLNACKLRDEGKDAEEIVQTVSARIPAVQTSFMLEKVDYLYKGGRCSLVAYIGASVLGLKPQILVKDGKMEPKRKYRGKFEKAIIKYVNDTLEDYNTPDYENVFITYSTAPEESVKEISAILKEKGFENVYPTTAGCTISSHCGPHTLGIIFINDGNK